MKPLKLSAKDVADRWERAMVRCGVKVTPMMKAAYLRKMRKMMPIINAIEERKYGSQGPAA